MGDWGELKDGVFVFKGDLDLLGGDVEGGGGMKLYGLGNVIFSLW